MDKKDKPLWVAKRNDLVRARYHLTIAEQRVILICLSKIKPEEDITTKTVFEVSAMELAKYTGASRTSAYRDLRNVVDRLYWNEVFISDDEKFRWITYIKFGDDNASAKLTFSEQILPFISKLKNKFTKYDAKKAMYFKSAYALQIYEILAQFPDMTEQTVYIPKLREYLLIDDDEYAQSKEFKRRVIDPAVKDINSLSNISVIVETVTEKRVAVAFRFVYKVDSKKQVDKDQKKYNSYSFSGSDSNARIGESMEEYKKRLRLENNVKK
jgi:plasmid replication initiation protein